MSYKVELAESFAKESPETIRVRENGLNA